MAVTSAGMILPSLKQTSSFGRGPSGWSAFSTGALFTAPANWHFWDRRQVGDSFANGPAQSGGKQLVQKEAGLARTGTRGR